MHFVQSERAVFAQSVCARDTQSLQLLLYGARYDGVAFVGRMHSVVIKQCFVQGYILLIYFFECRRDVDYFYDSGISLRVVEYDCVKVAQQLVGAGAHSGVVEAVSPFHVIYHVAAYDLTAGEHGIIDGADHYGSRGIDSGDIIDYIRKVFRSRIQQIQ